MKTPVLIEHRATGGMDIWLRGRRTLRLTRQRARKINRFLTVLLAHADGRSVLKDEVQGKIYKRLTLVCGVLVNTRWGAVMVQWRGFGTR